MTEAKETKKETHAIDLQPKTCGECKQTITKVDQVCGCGWRLIHLAAYDDSYPLSAWVRLLSAIPDVDVKTMKSGCTALLIAASDGNLEGVRVLLAAKADVNATSIIPGLENVLQCVEGTLPSMNTRQNKWERERCAILTHLLMEHKAPMPENNTRLYKTIIEYPALWCISAAPPAPPSPNPFIRLQDV